MEYPFRRLTCLAGPALQVMEWFDALEQLMDENGCPGDLPPSIRQARRDAVYWVLDDDIDLASISKRKYNA